MAPSHEGNLIYISNTFVTPLIALKRPSRTELKPCTTIWFRVVTLPKF
jgi:hypothetical protein